jgi:hypothetical protein
MSVVAAPQSRPEAADPPRRPPRQFRWAVPTVITALNAVAFLLVRPDVSDLWAARARASAVDHGVGLSYWFNWFGGSTPGNYSVFTPYLCALVGTELLGALAAVAATGLATILLRGTRHPLAASALAAVSIIANLWSGRIPFLLGGAFGVAALIAVRSHRRAWTVGLTLLSVLASPVTGAFLAIGLSGTFLTTRTKVYRPIVTFAVLTAGAALIAVALVFGTPGPEPFEFVFALEVLGALVLLWCARPPDHLRTTLYVTALATVALFLIPNGMGSNISRLVFFCLPVAVIALSPLRSRILAIAVVPLAIGGGAGTVLDLVNASHPVSSSSYYDSLIHQLDATPGLMNCRVEVVNHGAHAGDAVLLDHAQLARGWETQENTQLNNALDKKSLDATTYKIWLDNNAVCYVALPADSVKSNPEYDLVAKGGIGYLTEIWQDDDWQLFEVLSPTHIVAAPASVIAYSQAAMTIRIPCACAVKVRVRWSTYLDAVLKQPAPNRAPAVTAEVSDDGSGWTSISTPRAGDYVLSGSLTGGFLR